MSAHVGENRLNGEAFPSILLLFRYKFDKFNNTGAYIYKL